MQTLARFVSDCSFLARLRQQLSAHTGLLCLWGLALFTWWVRYHPLGSDVVVLDDDARMHIYWMARFQDATLFPDDPITTYMSSTLFAPWGYQVLCRLGSSIMPPLLFTQLLSLALVLVSLWLLDALLRGVTESPAARFVGGCLFLFYHTHNVVHNILGGFARSFAVPILLLCVLFLQRQRFREALLGNIAALVLYPPIILNTLALAGDQLLRRWWQGQRWRLALDLGLLVLCTLGAAVYLLGIYEVDRSISGAQVTLAEARHMAEFYPGGRSVFFHPSLLVYLLSGRSGIGLPQLSGFVILIGIMGSVVGWRHFRMPPVAISLVWTSMVLFGLAHVLLFRLYLPSRYTFYTFSLASVLIISANARPFWQACRARRYVPDGMPLSKAWRSAVIVGLLVAYAVVQSAVVVKNDPRLVVLDRQDRDMLAFLHTLPKEVLIAGHPHDMDNVPIMALRKVLANAETAFPYYMGHYTVAKAKTMAALQAYYATSWQTVRAFIERYHIDALVVRKTHFSPAGLQQKIFFEPFESQLRAGFSATRQFVLAAPPKSLTCFENERYLVLCVSPLVHADLTWPEERAAR